MDIVEPINDPRGVKKILHGAFAVVAAIDINHMHRCTGCAVMHTAARQCQVVAFITPAERNVARGLGQHVLDQSAGKAQPPVVTQDRPGFDHGLHPAWRGIGQPDHLQRVQRGMVQPLDLGIGQGLVIAAGHSRTDGAFIFGQGCGAECVTCSAATRASCWTGHVLILAWIGDREVTDLDARTPARRASPFGTDRDHDDLDFPFTSGHSDPPGPSS